MNTLELSKVIGQSGTLRALPYLTFNVLVLNAKIAYGNVRYLVTPVSGTGSVWVDAGRVSFENPQEKGNGQ